MKSTSAVFAVFASVALLVASPTWSQERGAYLGASLGQVEHKQGCTGVTISCDQKDTSWRIFGGYEFNRHIAVELGYANLGETSASGIVSGVNVTANIEVGAWDLTAVGSIPVMDRLSLYGRAGLYLAETEASGTGSVPGFSTSFNESESNSGFTFGLGVKFSILRNLAVRGEWRRYVDVGGDDVGESDVDVLSVGLLYRF
jgi:OOP family OmpA-OmpF porin